MRRLVIDETYKHAVNLHNQGDKLGLASQLTLLKNIYASITSTIKPGETPHTGKIQELLYIKQCIDKLKLLA